MNKIGILFALSILLLFISANLISALDTSQIQQIPQQIEDNKQKIEDIKGQYLDREWLSVLNKTQVGSVMIALSPVFKLTIGAPFTLSWIFFLSLITWIALIIIIYYAVRLAFPELNFLITLPIAIIIPTIAAQTGIIQQSVNFMSPLLKNPWIIITAIGAGVILLEIYRRLMLSFRKMRIGWKKKEKEAEREEKAKTTEKLHDIKLKGTGIKRN
ncbi:MAG: hypothetical protein Q8L29_01045 [archaeon]|nr:hypothetical protein [archaeon]